MFDFSWSELLLVALVAFLLVKPEDLPPLIRQIRKAKQGLLNIKNEITDSFQSIDEVKQLKEELEQEKFDTIIDLNGNPQRIYDIDEVKRDIERSQIAKPGHLPPSDKPS